MSSKNVNIVASWLIEHCHTGNFSLPVLIFKYLNLKNCFASFVQKCKTCSKEVLVNEINGIVNSEKFSCYDDMYLGVTFLGHRILITNRYV